MLLTDTHTHLYYETDPDKRSELMQRCAENSVDRLFLPNVDLESVQQVFDLKAAYPQRCFPMLGLHPCSVKAGWEEELDAIFNSQGDDKIYAIGEIGIDLYWDKTNLPEQVKAFKRQIAIARSGKLPIVIHCREAFDEVFEVLEEEKDDDLFGILHCFTGTLEYAQRVIGLGFMLGIGGVVTYKNGGIDKILPEIDLKHIVLETDSPYLTPVPYRGKKRNESSYLIYVAQKVAEIYGLPIEDIARITTDNSKQVFGV
jgi:TatD DNase family protein